MSFVWEGPHGVSMVPSSPCPSSFTAAGVTSVSFSSWMNCMLAAMNAAWKLRIRMLSYVTLLMSPALVTVMEKP